MRIFKNRVNPDPERMSDEDTANNITEKASRDFGGWEQKFEDDVNNTPKDVNSLKKLAFSIPERLPSKLHLFWVAKVLAMLARFILIGVIEIKKDFTAFDAKKVLTCFLSDDELDMSINMVKARLSKNSFMMEEFMGLLHDVMSHVSITEQLRCKHQSSFFKKIFCSPFCTPCLEEDRRIQRKKDIILGNKMNLDIVMQESLEKSLAVSGSLELEGVAGGSGSFKRKNKEDLNYSA